MSEARILQLSKQLDAATRNADALGRRYAAHLALHGAAVLEDDKEQMLELRQACHALLDRVLDNGEHIQKLSNELTRLAQGG